MGATHVAPFLFMPIATLTLEIRIEHAQSLKDKRQVLRSLKAWSPQAASS